MAFNLLIELPADTLDWEELNRKTALYSELGIECFPIADTRIFTKNYVGLSVLNYEMTPERINAFKEIMHYLLERGSEVFELYASSRVSSDNLDALIKKFLL